MTKTMTIISTAVLSVILMLAAGCGDDPGAGGGAEDYAYTPAEEDYAYTEDGTGYVNNIILVYFDDNASESDKEEIVSETGGTVVGRMDTLNQYQIRVEAASYEELKSICRTLEAERSVTMAAIDYTLRDDVSSYYPEEGYSDGWDEARPAGQNWGQEAIHAPAAWGYRSELETIDVAVVDNGFDLSHDDLNRNLQIRSGYEDANTVQDHGNEVSGIIGATFDNSIGISGMAPNAQIFCYPVGGGERPMSTSMANVVNAVKDGAKVVNLSRGCSSNLKYDGDQEKYNTWGRTASLELSRLLDQGYDFLIVQSAGNGNSSRIGVDARYNGQFCSIDQGNCYTEKHSFAELISHVVIVGSAYYEKGSFIQAVSSNGGDNVSLCAPGQNIFTTKAEGYEVASGTSLAAPFVTGTAALVWGAKPELKAAEVKEILTSTCSSIAADNPASQGATGSFGMLDAGAAVAAAAGNGAETEAGGFMNYLRQTYEEADEYANGYPVYYERENGIPDKSLGTTTWFKYGIADFDGDGEDEMLVYSSSLVAGAGDPGVDEGVGGYHYYECDASGKVKEVRGFTILVSFDDCDITCYDNGIIDLEHGSNESSSLMVIGFTDTFRKALGSYSSFDGEFLSYSFADDYDSIERSICSGFAVDASETISNDAYTEEYNRMHTGDVIDVAFQDIRKENLY